MFGFLKKTIPANEFGLAVLHYANEFISNDACRSLGSMFPNLDASKGWTPVFEKNGVAISTVKLYLCHYTHCVLQAAFKEYSQVQRRVMIQGANTALRETPPGYDFGKNFTDLEAVFDGKYKFDPRVEPLNDGGRMNYLAVPNAHVLVSKYLIDVFVLHQMKNSKVFIDNFGLYSSTIGSSIACAHRAMNAITSKAKIGP